MKLLNRFKIGARLGVAFALVLLLLCAVAGIGALQIKAINNRVDDFAGNIVPSLRIAHKLQADLMAMRRLESQFLLLNTEKDLSAMEGRIAKLRTGLTESLKEYEPLAVDSQDRANLQAANAAVQAYFGFSKTLMGLARQSVGDLGKHEEAKKFLFNDSSKGFTPAQEAVATIWRYNETLSQSAAASSTATYRAALAWMGAAASLALVLGMACALLIARSITVPMAQAVVVADSIGAGDLTARVEVRGNKRRRTCWAPCSA